MPLRYFKRPASTPVSGIIQNGHPCWSLGHSTAKSFGEIVLHSLQACSLPDYWRLAKGPGGSGDRPAPLYAFIEPRSPHLQYRSRQVDRVLRPGMSGRARGTRARTIAC